MWSGSVRNMYGEKLLLVGVTLVISLSECIPVPPNANCPVPTTNDEFGTSKVLDLHQIRGHKVRLQFFYPSEQSALRLLETTTLAPTTAGVGNNSSTSGDGSGSASVEEYQEEHKQDVFCQWTFRAGNESQFLSLTFEKLSAPYSDNCKDAFVALQKENGYESRWCGNRRQANARPMALIARSRAVITVYRSARAPVLPATGFKLAVREVDVIGSLHGAENSLRVLLG